MAENNLNRRDFLRGLTASAAGLGFLFEEITLPAEERPEDEKPKGPPINCGVIGLGPQGREILSSLAKLGTAPAVAICDSYTSEGFLARSKKIAPKAAFY